MGLFDQSSSPLSTLMPKSQPFKLPDYSNAFKMNWQPQMNTLKFQTGLATMNSSDPITAMNGRNMVNESVNLSETNNDSQQGGSNPISWDQGFQAMSAIGSKIGGQAGQVVSGIGNIGTNIKRVQEASKAAKAGVAGAGQMKAGSIRAAIGAASDLVGSFMPQKTEYEGEKGDITQTMDSVYDGISDAAMSFGPIGCVCAGSRVVNNKGKFLNIEDLVQEEGIIGWGNRKASKENIFALKTPNYKECLRIELESGTILECSTDHPILYSPKGRAERVTINGERKRVKQWVFKPAETLQVGDNVGIINEIPIWGEEEMWNPYLVGMLIGDGTYGKDHGVRLYSGDPDTWSYIEKYQLGGKINFDDSQYTSEFRGYRIFNGAEQLRLLGLYEQTKCNKRLPINIHKYTKESICKLIAGLIDTDGCVQSNLARKEFKVIFYQKNETLIKQLREQLLKLGIHSSIQSTKERKSTIRGREINSSNGYKLVIKDKLSLVNFYNNISLNIQYKQKALEEIYSYCQLGSTKDNRLLSGAKADKVVLITPIGSKLVYNLQADDDHTYVANGIITHNTLVGGIMKGGALLGKGVNALGGGTDGMTSTDAILGSSFLNLTPLGLINGFGGKKADTITKDNEAFAQVGSSYTGSNAAVDDALKKSGKKYGLLSSGARKRANEEIAEAKRQQSIISDISSNALDRANIRTSMSAINGNRRDFLMRGGYDQASIRVGRRGMSIELLNKARSILKAQKGSKLDPMSAYKNQAPKDWESIPNTGKPTYQEWAKDVNPDFQSESYDLETAYNNLPYDQMQRWKFAVNSNNPNFYLDFHQGDNYPFHTTSVAPLQGTEDYIFLKKGTLETNPELKGELDYYDNSGEFKNNYNLSYEGDHYYYRRKKPTIKQETPQHKNGGSIIELTTETVIDLINPLEVPEFQNGGSINVIPDGALHARKHNMNLDGITEKGIPVVSEKDNGKIEQQAEIEKEEVIFRLEVTQKLEELEKKYYSEEASQKEKDEYALEAGKLITEELLHNTKDNAGLL